MGSKELNYGGTNREVASIFMMRFAQVTTVVSFSLLFFYPHLVFVILNSLALGLIFGSVALSVRKPKKTEVEKSEYDPHYVRSMEIKNGQSVLTTCDDKACKTCCPQPAPVEKIETSEIEQNQPTHVSDFRPDFVPKGAVVDISPLKSELGVLIRWTFDNTTYHKTVMGYRLFDVATEIYAWGEAKPIKTVTSSWLQKMEPDEMDWERATLQERQLGKKAGLLPKKSTKPPLGRERHPNPEIRFRLPTYESRRY